jgi:membrane-associated protease RseP (regulator of RpoE activity)
MVEDAMTASTDNQVTVQPDAVPVEVANHQAAAGLPPDWRPPRRRPGQRPSGRLRLQIYLYLGTCLTTFASGTVGWQPLVLGLDDTFWADVHQHWPRGLTYMVAVMAILTAHEAGHFLAAQRHGIPATLPFFLPVPVMLTGTLGAVIGMEGSRADRRQLFDIALAGPLAGLAVAVPVLAAGMASGVPDAFNPFALPLLGQWLLAAIRPDLSAGQTLAPNALLMAGWVGLLVTGLNMIPISQLDGGHVCHALFGRRSYVVTRAVLLAAIGGIIFFGGYHWVAMVVIITFMGADHPPIRDEDQPLDPWRWALGLASCLIPIVTFMPEPLQLR